MESVCLVVAILDLYIVGVNRRNWGLALIRGERVKYINIMRGNQSVSQSVQSIHLLQTFLIGLQFIDSLNSAYSTESDGLTAVSNVKVRLSHNVSLSPLVSDGGGGLGLVTVTHARHLLPALL